MQFAAGPVCDQVENIYAAQATGQVVAGPSEVSRLILVVRHRQNPVRAAGEVAIERANRRAGVGIRQREAIHVGLADSHVVVNAERADFIAQACIAG